MAVAARGVRDVSAPGRVESALDAAFLALRTPATTRRRMCGPRRRTIRCSAGASVRWRAV